MGNYLLVYSVTYSGEDHCPGNINGYYSASSATPSTGRRRKE